MGVRHVLCHFIILLCLIVFLFGIMYYVVSDNTYPSKYCNPDLCPIGARHIGCHHPGYGLICIKPRSTIFTTGMKRMIVDKHNKLRSKLASGKMDKFKSAVRMGIVKWNNALSYLALLNSKECQLRYDECRNTKDYREVGQNIAGIAVNYKTINSDIIYEVIPNIIDLWFSESVAATQERMDNYKIGHGMNIQNFSNIIHERTIKIGCGLTTYYSLSKKLEILFVCNYSFRPYPRLPIYTSGPSCSKCVTGCNTEYNGLCNKGEIIYSDIH